MHSFQSFSADMLECSPFDKIGKEWMLVTAGNEEKVNTMTASWGGMGVMWGKNAAFVVIRQSRYTKEFIDREGTFSLSFLGEKHRNMLKYLGTVSGRTEDKLKEAGVEIDYQNGVPYVDQANLVLICRAMSATEIKPEEFLDGEIDEKWYADKDYHTLYIAEITDFLAR